MHTSTARSIRAKVWLTTGFVLTAVVVTASGFLIYWAGEIFRHDEWEPGDAALGFILGFGCISLLVVVSGYLVNLGLPALAARRQPRAAATYELAAGAVAAVWFVPTAIVWPFAVISVPVIATSFYVAGSLRRTLNPERTVRSTPQTEKLNQLARRYLPHFVAGASVTVLLGVGIWLVTVGGACHTYVRDGWGACSADGSLLRASLAIGVASTCAALIMNLVWRIRGSRLSPGWPVALLVGSSLVGALLASHLIP